MMMMMMMMTMTVGMVMMVINAFPFLVGGPDKKRSLLELSMKYANPPENNSPFRFKTISMIDF